MKKRSGGNMRKKNHYKVQVLPMSCKSCDLSDIIVENYELVMICILDYFPVDVNGICERFKPTINNVSKEDNHGGINRS
jgi:hypothetical protein